MSSAVETSLDFSISEILRDSSTSLGMTKYGCLSNEDVFCLLSAVRWLNACANAIAGSTKASVHIRRHDETEARRRAGAIAGRQMGRVRLRRCRSGGEH